MNPFFLMAFLYFGVALLTAGANALNALGVLPYVNGFTWLRVHFITLGIITELAFGFLPIILSKQKSRERPPLNWQAWLTLNAGLALLLVGIPTINSVFITLGGGLIFLAVLLLMQELYSLGTDLKRVGAESIKFYLAGLGFLLIGIVVGTGLWQQWLPGLRIAVPIEVHIHANSWGFMALVFAGLLIDLYPAITGKALAWPKSTTPIFWLMTFGALGLVLGPWLPSKAVLAPGLVMHAIATIWLLINIIKPIWGDKSSWTPGMWHLTSSYLWFFAPVFFAPFVLFKVNGFSGVGIEQNAPQALVYGWILQFSFALMPFLLTRVLKPTQKASLGGSWASLILAHSGSVFLWLSIFLVSQQMVLKGVAYSLWTFAAIPIFLTLWRSLNNSSEASEVLSDRLVEGA